MIKRIDATPRETIPFEYPSRSPLIVNILGMYLSLARLKDSIGNAEKPVFAASTNMIAVVP